LTFEYKMNVEQVTRRFGAMRPVLDELERDGWVVRTADGIAPRAGLAWNHLATLRKDQKAIVSKLVQNPKTVYLLHHVRYDTSMDEPRRAAREILRWPRGVVAFVVCLNDKKIGEQLTSALRIMELSAHTLSSASTFSVADGRKAIDAYRDDAPMPVFVTLANVVQLDKMHELMAHVQQRGMQYGVVVLDADQTYPVVATDAAYRSFIRADEPAFHALLLATTDLMDDSIYPECVNARVVDVSTHANFRSIRHAVWRTYPVQYGLPFVRAVLGDIDLAGRKILLPMTGRADTLARMCTARGTNVLIYRDVLTLVRADLPDVVCRTGRVTPEHVAQAVDKYQLDSVVLMFGNVPSGSFQCASWAWTDLILAQDEDRASAVRKCGRLSGVLPAGTTLTVWSTNEMMQRVMSQEHVPAAPAAPAARTRKRRAAEPLRERVEDLVVRDSYASIPRRARPSEPTLSGVRAAMRRDFPDWYREVREYEWAMGAPTLDVTTQLVQATVRFVPFSFDAGETPRVTCVLDGEWAYAVVWNGRAGASCAVAT
jgi:hypothetical protein